MIIIFVNGICSLLGLDGSILMGGTLPAVDSNPTNLIRIRMVKIYRTQVHI